MPRAKNTYVYGTRSVVPDSELTPAEKKRKKLKEANMRVQKAKKELRK